MAGSKTLSNRPRPLRDGECIIDCAKAGAVLDKSMGRVSEDRASVTLGITRSVLRRILGKDDTTEWAIITVPNARSFAEKCGVRLAQIEWVDLPSSGEDGEQPDVAAYLRLWRELFGLGLAPLVPLNMVCGDAPIDAEGLFALLRDKSTLELTGPSGCGKSHLLTHLALAIADRGHLPIFTRVADFEGDIDNLLDRAVSSFSSLGYGELIKAARKSSLVPVVIFDALNECPSNLRVQFLAGLQKLRVQFPFPIFLSSQTLLSLPTTLSGSLISISLPDKAKKRELVEAHLKRSLPEAMAFSLDLISTAQDAMVWADVFKRSDVATSRYALYEAYVRLRLGGTPNVGLAQRALSFLASEMRKNFVFSVPEATLRRAVDHVSADPAHTDDVIILIEQSGLVQVSNRRAAFKHELLQDFFAAQELLRSTRAPQTLGRLLSKPLNAGLAEFAIGALSSGAEVVAALAELNSIPLISACLSGQCGPVATTTVEGSCIAALERLRKRYCAVSFDLPTEASELTVDPSRCAPYERRDVAYLSAAMMIFPDGRMVRPVLEVIRGIDAHIENERERLRGRYPTKKFAWRARMFTSMYCMPLYPGPDEFRVSLQNARSSGFWRDAKESYDRVAALLVEYRTLTPGQLYFLIEGFHGAYTRAVSPPAFLYDLAARAWNFGIYHLQLATTHMLTLHCHNLSEHDRQRFIALAESWLTNENPVMNSCVIDVLKTLGALDDQFTSEQATAEFEEVLALPPSQGANERAFSVYCLMFDHPYDSAYGEAFYALSDNQRQALIARAAQTENTNSMFYSFLLMELTKNPTQELVPALQRVAFAPNTDTLSSQDSMSTFISAVASLARLGAPLPTHDSEQDILLKAWNDIRHIIYLLHTPDITREEYLRGSDAHWKNLEDEHLIDFPMRVLRDRWRDQDDTSARFMDWSKDRLLRLSRDTLANEYSPKSSFAYMPRLAELRAEHVNFALSILEKYGDRGDLPRISSLVGDVRHGVIALKAAHGIESR